MNFSIARMRLLILVGTLAWTNASTAMAIEALPSDGQTVRLNLDSVAIQGPALDRPTRVAYGLEYLFPIREGLRVGALVQVAADDETKTKRLNVTEDYYWLAPSIELSYAYLFRYALQIAPTYVYSSTTVELDETTDSLSTTQFGLAAFGRVQYAVHPTVDLGLVGGYHIRLDDDKSDWLYGIEIALNISNFGRSSTSSNGKQSTEPSNSAPSRRRRG